MARFGRNLRGSGDSGGWGGGTADHDGILDSVVPRSAGEWVGSEFRRLR